MTGTYTSFFFKEVSITKGKGADKKRLPGFSFVWNWMRHPFFLSVLENCFSSHINVYDQLELGFGLKLDVYSVPSLCRTGVFVGVTSCVY